MGKTGNAVLNAEFVFANDGALMLAQEFVIVKQTSRNGVLNRHQSHHTIVLAHFAKDLLKGITANQVDVCAEMLARRNVVERTWGALDGNLQWILGGSGIVHNVKDKIRGPAR